MRFVNEFLGITPIDECRATTNMLLCAFAAFVGWLSFHRFGYNFTVIVFAAIAGARFARGK